MSFMRDLFLAAQARQVRKSHVLTDDAVLHAVNLGAMVHNLLGAYQQAIESGDFFRYRRKIYELSAEFHKPEVAAARENMRQELVRRIESGEEAP